MATITEQVLTANRLSDGAVVYLTESGTWSERIAESRVARTAQESAALLADGLEVAEGWTADPPYLIDVTANEEGVWPVRYRERLRASGPSVHPEFARQPANRG